MSARALITASLLLTAALAGAGPRKLFIPSGRAADRSASPRIGVMRSRAVDIDLSALLGAGGALPRAGQAIILNLFDDVVLRARTLRAQRTEHGMTWVGKLVGQPLGDAVIVVHDGIVAGSVTSPDGAYAIRWDGGGQVVEQLDHSAFPENGRCFEDVKPSAPEVAEPPPTANDDGSLIDVLVAYTPAARAAAGGTAQVQAQIQLAIAETNQGYANSNVVQRLRLVGSVETPYAEADISTDLGRVTDPSDGYMDDIPALRDTFRADLVSLIGSGYASGGFCGLAWLLQGNDPGFAPNAYSVVDLVCMTGIYSFGHELGHNMGLHHARVDGVNDGAYFYSHGHKDPGNAFRTVMAYCCGYPSCSAGCPRILHYSNPNVLYSSKPTGVNCTDPSCIVPDTVSAFNALSLNNTRVTVANWRVGQSADLAVTKTDGVSAVTPGLPVTYTIQVSNIGPGPVANASVIDGFPASLTAVNWTCSASAGSSCSAASGSGSINRTVSLLVGGSATFAATGTLNPAATGTLVNTATVAPPSGSVDPNPMNNSSTDMDTILTAANVAVTKTDGLTMAVPGQAITYTIVASNAGPNPVNGAGVSDPVPASLLSPTWTCVAAGGASCPASGSGSISHTIRLPVGGTATYTLHGTLSPNPPGLSNTAIVTLPAGYGDPNPANNSATDSDLIQYPATDFYTVTPCRLIDTRNPSGPRGGPALGGGSTRNFPVTGVCGIPSTAKMISVNATAVGAAAAGYLTLYRGDATSAPLTSTINFSSGLTRANNAFVALAADGTIKVKNGSASAVDFVLDVSGYFE